MGMDYIYNTDNTEIVVETRGKSVCNKVVDELVALRKAKHMTQQDIADATGMKRANVARVEGKKFTPTIDVLMRYAECLGAEVEMRVVEKDKCISTVKGSIDLSCGGKSRYGE